MTRIREEEVNSVSRHAVFYSRMCCVTGRNVQYFCKHFRVCSLDVIDSCEQWKLMADEDIVSRPGMIQELSRLGMAYCACLRMTSHITMCLL